MWRIALVLAVAIGLTGRGASAAKPKTTKGMAWMLGSYLSLAALAHERGETEQSDSLFGIARDRADELKVEVPPLPVKTGVSSKDGDAVLRYMLNDAGLSIGPKLRKQYDQAHAVLFELAFKSNMLLMMYSPGGNLGKSIAGVIKRNGPQANLPEGLWKPVVDKIEAEASFEDVQGALFAMHKDVPRHLDASALNEDLSSSLTD